MLSVFFILSACKTGIVYQEVIDLKDQKWHKDSVMIFTASISDTVNAYDILFSIRHHHEYEYRNLILFVEVEAPGSNRLRDTSHLMLCDARGKWYGSGLGSVYVFEQAYKSNIRFPRSGIYRFSVQHGMRRENLDNILDLGLIIKKKVP
jgi:gliding motility-associated lipoprotein GldH